MPLPSLPPAIKAFARTRAGLPVLIGAAAVLIVATLTATRPRLQPVAASERVWIVDAVTIRHETLQPELDLFGEVVAGRRSELRALVAGPIARVGTNLRDGGGHLVKLRGTSTSLAAPASGRVPKTCTKSTFKSPHVPWL